MNFKITLIFMAFLICSCGVQGRPKPKDAKEFKAFNKIYGKKVLDEKTDNKKEKKK